MTVDGQALGLRLDLRNHSPTGFEWGYEGSGPAQLALAMLAHEIGDATAEERYQDFKRAVVGRLPAKGWVLTSAELRAWLDEYAAKGAAPVRRQQDRGGEVVPFARRR